MYAFDVSDADFEEKVVQASFRQPVVVDFWAPWCAPCKVLKPMLEKLADEYAGKFLLAKVNSDENPKASVRHRVRSIPTVKAVVNGEVVNEFTGALPERELRAWLEKIVPGPVDELRLAAQQLATAGDIDSALARLAEASALEPDNEWVRVDSAELLLAKGLNEEAQQLLDSVKDFDIQRDARVQQLVAQARLATMAAAGEGEAELSARVAENPDDLEARLKLANALIAMNRHAEGMDQLLEIVARDRDFQDDIGRRTLLDVFSLLGGGPLVSEYRRKLAGMLN